MYKSLNLPALLSLLPKFTGYSRFEGRKFAENRERLTEHQQKERLLASPNI
jgi:hypothetical protein